MSGTSSSFALTLWAAFLVINFGPQVTIITHLNLRYGLGLLLGSTSSPRDENDFMSSLFEPSLHIKWGNLDCIIPMIWILQIVLAIIVCRVSLAFFRWVYECLSTKPK